jgi:hypothetical protein
LQPGAEPSGKGEAEHRGRGTSHLPSLRMNGHLITRLVSDR